MLYVDPYMTLICNKELQASLHMEPATKFDTTHTAYHIYIPT